MTATMIKIEPNAKMTAAIDRCKKAHPKVRRIDLTTVIVSGRNAKYTVKIIQPREGLMLAECSCEAGRKGLLCYHIPAAFSAPAAAPAVAPRPKAKAEGILIKRQGNAMIIDGWYV
jgi:hypothetical protein